MTMFIMIVCSLIVLHSANLLADDSKRLQDCQGTNGGDIQEGPCVHRANASTTRNIRPGETGCVFTTLNYGSMIVAWINHPHSVGTDLSLTATLGSDRRPGRSQFHYRRNDVIGMQVPGTIRWTVCAFNGEEDTVAFLAKSIAIAPGFYYFVKFLTEAGRREVMRVAEGGDPALMIPRLPFFP